MRGLNHMLGTWGEWKISYYMNKFASEDS